MRPPRGRGGGFRGGRDGRLGVAAASWWRSSAVVAGRFGGAAVALATKRRDEGPSFRSQISTFVHACEGDAVTKLSNEKIPYFNAPIYLQNKTQIGKVDEIFRPINESFFIDPAKLLPLQDFFRSPKDNQAARGGGRGGGRGGRGGGGGFRGRGAPRGGRGGFRGGGRGGGFRGRGRS
ncbi:hypothetical protein Pfo_028140 [Paulownia fortunei]|nr:hypothetical protein Pfo_028140 [Paulownia fortunei]